MFTILLTDFGDFGTWMQVVVGIAALIVAIISLLQSKKIKELVDITEELARQTGQLQKQSEVLEKRFALEQMLSLEQRVPVFEPGELLRYELPLKYKATLKNIGKKAFKIKVKNINTDSYNATSTSDSCGTNDIIEVMIAYNNNISIINAPPFEFELVFENNYNYCFTQKIQQMENLKDYIIHPPNDPLLTQ